MIIYKKLLTFDNYR